MAFHSSYHSSGTHVIIRNAKTRIKLQYYNNTYTRTKYHYKSALMRIHNSIIGGRTLSAMKEAFELLDTVAKKMGLAVNEIATKYMVADHNIPCNTKVNNSRVYF
jgi:hypothetical protein